MEGVLFGHHFPFRKQMVIEIRKISLTFRKWTDKGLVVFPLGQSQLLSSALLLLLNKEGDDLSHFLEAILSFLPFPEEHIRIHVNLFMNLNPYEFIPYESIHEHMYFFNAGFSSPVFVLCIMF